MTATTDDDLAATLREVIRRDGADSARSAQSADHLIGPSEVGACRAYLAHMVARTPKDQLPSIGWEAFIGSAVGDRIETAWTRIDPTARNQVPLTCVLPSGLAISGSADLVLPDRVVDIKTKASLALTRRRTPTFRHRAQIQVYLLGLIQEGILPPAATASLAYVDRSGRDDTPAVFTYNLDMDIITMIDERLSDVAYAVAHDLDDAPRDEAYEYCSRFCEFFTHCRGKDEHLTAGLITDEDALAAVKAYTDALAMTRTADAIKDEAKHILTGVQGRAGDVEVTWTHVNETTVPTYVRAGYDSLSIRKPRKARTPKKEPA